MNQYSRLRIILDKYLDNTCSESELQELLDLLKQVDHEPGIKQILDEYWKGLSEKSIHDSVSSSRNAEEWFEEIYTQALQRDEVVTYPLHDTGTDGRGYYSNAYKNSYWIRIAAVLLIAFGISMIYFTMQSVSDPVEVVEFEYKTAGPGEKVRFVLPDGTQVHLNSESELRYSNSFNDRMREVHLIGEAYFIVVRDEERPFLVHSKEITTRVLGTSFNFRSYPENEQAIVAVNSGRVAVAVNGKDNGRRDKKGEVVLKAGQWTGYTPETHNFITGSGDISEYVAWNNGTLLYHDRKLGHVAKQLERWYGVEITFENEDLRNCVIRGEHQNEALTNVLNAIAYAFDMQYRIDGRQVSLSGDGCE